ncbi:MAG: tetratricopeptide repeat protein [Sphingomonadaceae bacterium]
MRFPTRRVVLIAILALLALVPGSEGWSGSVADGDRLASQHRLQSALQRYHDAARFPGGEAAAGLRVGRTHLRRWQPLEAAEAFRRAEEAGGGAEALLGLAEALEQVGDRQASLGALARALELRPHDATAWTRVVEQAARSGLPRAEIEGLLPVAAPSGVHGALGQRVDYLLGACLLGPASQEGEAALRRAAAGPDRVLRERSEELLLAARAAGSPEGRAIAAARALLAQGLAGPALDDLEKVTADGSGEAEVWALRGCALRLAGRTDEAEEALRRSLELSPNDPLSGLLLASLLRARGDTGAAARLLTGIVETAPPEPALYAELCNLLVERGEYGEAERALRRAVEAAPESAELRLALARFHVDRQYRVDAGLPEAREAVRLSGGSAEALGTLAWALHLTSRSEDALGPAREAVEKAPESPMLPYRLGSILEALGQRDEAREQFLMVWELDGQGEQWRRARAALEEMQDPAGAWRRRLSVQ